MQEFETFKSFVRIGLNALNVLNGLNPFLFYRTATTSI